MDFGRLVNLGQLIAFVCVLYCAFELMQYIGKWLDDNYIAKPIRVLIWISYGIFVWFVIASISFEYTDYDY